MASSNMACNVPRQAPTSKIPKDGFGPGGAPECYYESRVLNSTFRYVKFVKRLRAQEEDQRKGAENKLKTAKDQLISDFFRSCDRRFLINNVANRVALCMESYQQDLNEKRKRLIQLYSAEEEENIRKFVVQAQAGREAVWQDKKDRLKYLLEKRRKEHEEKYKDTPLSKCVHVLPCIYKVRAMEAAQIQQYQIREKQARKMAEKEFDKMWYEVAMKESDALKARMEYDAIERFRKDLACKQYAEYQLEQEKQQRERERKMLEEETKRFKSIWEEDNKKEEEAERMRAQKRLDIAHERKEMIKERQETLKRLEDETKLVDDTWDSLAGQGLAEENAKVQLARKKKMDNDICNRNLAHLKHELAKRESDHDVLVSAEHARLQKKVDEKRCAYLMWSQNTNRDVRTAMLDQIKERAEASENLKKKLEEQEEYQGQLFNQLQELNDLKVMEEARNRKMHQKHLLDQIEYNKTLKERARQEELEQLKKAKLAAEEYQNEINRMMCRPFFSDEVHPFMKQMFKGLEMKEKCPCSKPDYCQP